MSYELISTEKINALFDEFKVMREQINGLKEQVVSGSKKTIYDNKEIQTLLNVGDKLIKKYRDKGLLSYHQVDDKYWYTSTDVEAFLAKNRFAAFA